MEFCLVSYEAHCSGVTIYIAGFLTDSAALGYSPREAMQQIARRLKEGEN